MLNYTMIIQFKPKSYLLASNNEKRSSAIAEGPRDALY